MIAIMATLLLQSTAPVQGLSDVQVDIAVERLRGELDYALLDYSSARMRDITLSAFEVPGEPQSLYFCGEINAKNAYGGYTGWQVVSGGVRFDQDQLKASVVIFDDAVVTERYRAEMTEAEGRIGETACLAVLAGLGTDKNLEASEALNP